MGISKTIFSTAVRTQWGDGSCELSYDDGVVRVVTVPPGGADVSSDYYLLQAKADFECTNPKCLPGIPPVISGVPCTIEIQMPAEVQTLSGGQQVLLAGPDDSKISIPIIDVSLVPRSVRPTRPENEVGDGDVLCKELHRYRRRAEIEPMASHMAFHVYQITDTPVELAALRGKRIALPVRDPAANQMAIDAQRVA